MTSILRSPQALQLTLALIKPDAVAHPLILEVRMTPEPLLYSRHCCCSGAMGSLVQADGTVLCRTPQRQSQEPWTQTLRRLQTC